jgi:hypothetical protein
MQPGLGIEILAGKADAVADLIRSHGHLAEGQVIALPDDLSFRIDHQLRRAEVVADVLIKHRPGEDKGFVAGVIRHIGQTADDLLFPLLARRVGGCIFPSGMRLALSFPLERRRRNEK